VVGMKCLEAGLELKRRNEGRCVLQVCAFAQLALFESEMEGDGEGKVIRRLMVEAAGRPGVDVLGSTPYVEEERDRMERNVEWMVDLCMESGKHLDFHLDYNLDAGQEPMVWHVVKTLKKKEWGSQEKTKGKTVVLGHCTRLTHFSDEDWTQLVKQIGRLPISFVGLPTSDLFMMRHPSRTRGTLDIPRLIQYHGLMACIGMNNIGNAFTPHGSCDPVTLACNGVGIYQAGTKEDAEVLYECVSTRARKAIGLLAGERDMTLDLKEGDDANLVLFGEGQGNWSTRRSVAEAVYLYDHGRRRFACLDGRITTGSR